MMRRFFFILLVLPILTGFSSRAFAAELNVTVTGLRSTQGEVHVALYDDPGRFPENEKYIADEIVTAKADEVTVTFKGLAAGNYALAVYHDENGNREFDQIIFGIPLEGYGFSNGATVFFGPPDFEDAAVTLDEPAAEIAIRMTYW